MLNAPPLSKKQILIVGDVAGCIDIRLAGFEKLIHHHSIHRRILHRERLDRRVHVRGDRRRNGRVDAVEEARFLRWTAARQTRVVRDRRFERVHSAAVLRALKCEAEAREALIGVAEPRTELAGVGAPIDVAPALAVGLKIRAAVLACCADRLP